MNAGKHVLAMYDIRGKQDFIFRTNKLKEIVGGSWIIRDCFEDYLFPAALNVSKEKKGNDGKGIYMYRREEKFTALKFLAHLEEGYIGEVVYSGGGNFQILFEDEEIYKKVTYQFTKKLLQKIGTLQVLGVCVTIDGFEDFKSDRKKLYKVHRVAEARESDAPVCACLPVVQVDRQTSMPIIYKDTGRRLEYSKESYAKIEKYKKVVSKLQKKESPSETERYFLKNTDIFDELIEEKGEDSQLAVIYIDGNGMGAKVADCLKNEIDYESCINELRHFSKEINDVYVSGGINNALKKSGEDEKYRIVVYAGDEVNFIVKARDALSCAESYLKGLNVDRMESACAGIAVFHSHAPYADAYRIAEECCESGKTKMKELEFDAACLIDFHICQGVSDISLESIREKESGSMISRPWLYSIADSERVKAENVTAISDVDRLAGLFRVLGRGNVKGLAEPAQNSGTRLEMELRRIRAHLDERKKQQTEEDWKWLFDKGNHVSEKKRKMIYDIAVTFDFWFEQD